MNHYPWFMEESKDIRLPLGTVSKSEELGSYYIDMRPAMVHYEQNIWGGKFDELGVPMIKVKDAYEYFPINIAQYGFMLHAQWCENEDSLTLYKLTQCLSRLEELKDEGDHICIWWHKFYNEKYDIEPPWASAMAQGECISFYLRMYQINGQKSLLRTAFKAFRFMRDDDPDKGVRRYDSAGYLWLEEYPSNPPSFVLNGFIYALFGLYDLHRVTKDREVKADIEQCINTLKGNISRFDCGYWSIYDLQKKELVRYYYQLNVHVPQLEVLYQLTGEEIFNDYKQKWENQATKIGFLIVRIMYRIRPRLQKIRKFFKRCVA